MDNPALYHVKFQPLFMGQWLNTSNAYTTVEEAEEVAAGYRQIYGDSRAKVVDKYGFRVVH